MPTEALSFPSLVSQTAKDATLHPKKSAQRADLRNSATVPPRCTLAPHQRGKKAASFHTAMPPALKKPKLLDFRDPFKSFLHVAIRFTLIPFQ